MVAMVAMGIILYRKTNFFVLRRISEAHATARVRERHARTHCVGEDDDG